MTNKTRVYDPLEHGVPIEKEDYVNSPSHYNQGNVEVIEIIEQQAEIMANSGIDPKAIPHISNAIKYLCRFQTKGKPKEDLEKAIWYINRAIKNIEN